MESRIIRKLSVGKDYPDGAMHFQVGKSFKLKEEVYRISRITENEELLKIGKTGYDIMIENINGTVLWKTIIDLPVVVENDVNFE